MDLANRRLFDDFGIVVSVSGVLRYLARIPSEIKSRIGYLPEETYLYRYWTAMETLDFTVRCLG